MKLFLLDAYALIYRSYYAFIKNPRINSKGLNSSAIFGFVNTLEEILKKENPTHIAVAFDPPGGTFRHEAYEKYKAQREETPEDIKKSIPIIKEIINAYNIKILEVPKFEADDVIGTLAKKAEKENFDVYMVTPDKDYGQLTSKHIFMYKPKYGAQGFEVLNDEDIMKKYELRSPSQMIDFLGIMGDTSDNIPGCPGVGPKTAQKLLDEYGSIEDILKNTNKITGSLKLKIEQNEEQILFSKFLATIKIDVPIEFEKSEFERKNLNEEKLQELFEKLEFRSLINRVLKENKITPSLRDPLQLNMFEEIQDNISDENKYSSLTELKDVDYKYYLVDNEDKIYELMQKILNHKKCAFDTETSGLDPVTSELVGMSFSFTKNEAYYVPLIGKKEDKVKCIKKFENFFNNINIAKIGQNIKFDIIALKKYGIEIQEPIFDTMIAHYIINPELRHNMDYMAQVYLNYKTIHIEELIGSRGKNQLSMKDLFPQQIKDYACEDADITFQLATIIKEKIANNENEEKLLNEIELPLVKVLSDMEYIGVQLDKKALEEISSNLNEEIKKLESEIYQISEQTFNINSAKQVGEILFDKLKIVDKPKKTKTGQYVTSEETLEKLKNSHPIIDKILEYRGVKKLVSTYVDTLPELTDKNGKLHTSFNQTVTATGRLSSSNPNLQNIPIRGERGKEIRKAFICEDGCLFLSADYSQIELRIMAHLSNDLNMIDAFNSGEDIHAATAAKIYKIPLEEVTTDMRRKAKTANFGIIYGISVFGLAERLTISRSEAKELIEGYFETYPQVKKYMDKSIEIAKDQGYVETIFGRKRYLPDINSKNATVRGYAERNAINAPIQGSAADIIKLAMIKIYDCFKAKNLKSKMILQVHDELNFNVVENELEEVKKIVIFEMENAYKLNIPLKVDCGIGKNWLEAH